jgi:hypothetical protein
MTSLQEKRRKEREIRAFASWYAETYPGTAPPPAKEPETVQDYLRAGNTAKALMHRTVWGESSNWYGELRAAVIAGDVVAVKAYISDEDAIRYIRGAEAGFLMTRAMDFGQRGTLEVLYDIFKDTIARDEGLPDHARVFHTHYLDLDALRAYRAGADLWQKQTGITPPRYNAECSSHHVTPAVFETILAALDGNLHITAAAKSGDEHETYCIRYRSSMAYKASVLFRDMEQVKTYLEKWDKGRQGLLQMMLNIKISLQNSRIDMKAWGDMLITHGPYKIGSLIQIGASPVKTEDGSGYDYNKTRDAVAVKHYKGGEEAPVLAALCFRHGYDQKRFDVARHICDIKRQAQAGCVLPEVTVDGARAGLAGTVMTRLDPMDVRGLEYTDFFVGDLEGKADAQAFLDPEAAVFIVTAAEDKSRVLAYVHAKLDADTDDILITRMRVLDASGAVAQQHVQDFIKIFDKEAAGGAYPGFTGVRFALPQPVLAPAPVPAPLSAPVEQEPAQIAAPAPGSLRRAWWRRWLGGAVLVITGNPRPAAIALGEDAALEKQRSHAQGLELLAEAQKPFCNLARAWYLLDDNKTDMKVSDQNGDTALAAIARNGHEQLLEKCLPRCDLETLEAALAVAKTVPIRGRIEDFIAGMKEANDPRADTTFVPASKTGARAAFGQKALPGAVTETKPVTAQTAAPSTLKVAS